MEEFLKAVGVGVRGSKDLTFEQAKEAMHLILDGESDDIETGAFWMAMRYKGETVEELTGFLQALREETRIIDVSGLDPVDLSVPYDGKNRTPHILPAAIFIATANGVKLTGHGSENVPAKYGSSYYDVLIEMGCCYLKDKEDVINALEKSGFAYLPQWCFNRKLFAILPKRRKFHLRTYLNVIEKLINPFNSKKIVAGIFHKPYFKKLKELLISSGFEDFYVVKGLEGGIEPNPFRETLLIDKNENEIKIKPVQDWELTESPVNLKENAKICLSILRNENIPYKSWAVQTAAFLLFTGKVVDSIEEGIEVSLEALSSWKAFEMFENYRKVTQLSSSKIRVRI